MFSKVGSFNSGVGATGTTQEITIGFEAKVIFFWWNGSTGTSDQVIGETHRRGFGVATSTSARYCFTTLSEDAQGNSVGAAAIHNAACIASVTNGGSIDGLIDIFAIGSTSFTLTVDNVMPYDLRVHYLALGGSDVVNAAVGTVAANASGNFVVSGLGWQPNFAMLLGNTFPNSVPSSSVTNGIFTIGIATSSTNQATLSAGEDDGSATMDAGSHNTDNQFFSAVASTVGTTLSAREDFTSFDVGGFTTTAEISGFVEGIIVIYVALNCTNVVVGNSLTQTDITTDITVSGLGWKPAAGMVLSHCRAETTTATLARTDKTSIGAFTSATERVAHGVRDEDNVADSNVATAVEHDEVYVHIDTTNDSVVGLMDVKSVDTGGVTFIMDDADPAQAFFGYVLFGPAETEGETKSLTDTGSGIETDLSIQASLSTIDVASSQDVASLQASLALIDTTSGIDNPIIAASLGLTDIILGGDFLDISGQLSVLDTILGADNVYQLMASLSLYDIGSGLEGLTLSALLVLSDIGLGTDEIIILQAILKAVQDLASAFDNISISATLSTSDNSDGQDTLNIQVQFSIIEAGTGVDSPEIAAALGVIDTALGGDFLGLSALLNLIENGFGSDELSNLIASLFIGDSTLGTDEINVLTAVLILISEFGAGSDEVANILASLSLEELGTVTEVISQLASLSLSDLAAGIDSSEIGAQLGISDTVLGGDFLDLSALVQLAEFGISADEISQLLASLAVNDTGLGIDTISILIALLIAITDFGAGSDQVANILASLSTSDVGTISEALSQLAYLVKDDVGFGIDDLQSAAALGIIEGALGGDFLDLSASIPLSEIGNGADTLTQLLASLSLSDAGTIDDLLQLLANLSISDAGLGTDAINVLTEIIKSISDNGFGSDQINISASLSVDDTVLGIDALTISVSISILDTGLGTDEISVLQAILKQIVDSASGSDNLTISASLNIGETSYGIDDPAVQVALGLVDSGEGLESPVISAELSITDSSSATDIISILQTALKLIQDTGSGVDTISQITASIPVSESGLGADQIGRLLASLLVTDLGNGIDVIVKFDTTSNILRITFELNKPRMKFNMSQPHIEFELTPIKPVRIK